GPARMRLEEHRLSELDERDVQEIDPIARLAALVRVAMPGPRRGQDDVPWRHIDTGTIDDRGGTRVSCEHEPQGRCRMAMGPRGIAGHDTLIGGNEVTRRRVDITLYWIDHDQIAPFGLIGRHHVMRGIEGALGCSKAPYGWLEFRLR